MRRLKGFFLASLFLAAMFAWASGTTEQKSVTTAQPVKITYMQWYNNTESEAQEVQQRLDLFNEQYKGKIFVDFIMLPRDGYEAKTNTMAAANTLPDCTLLSEAMALDFASAGLLADVSTMYPKDAEPLKSLTFTYQGKAIGYSTGCEVLLTYYNKKLFDKAGVPYPPASADKAWTWAQFVDVAKKLTIDKNGRNATQEGFDPKNIVQYGADFNREWWMWPIACYSNGGGLMSPDGKELWIGKPESIEAIQAIADLYSKDHVAPSIGDKRSMASIDVNLLTGKVAMATSGQWEIGVSLKNSVPNGLEYGVGVLPKFKKAVTYNTGGPLGIFKTSKHIPEAMTFLRWWASETYPDGSFQRGILDGILMPFTAKYYQTEAAMRSWADPAITKTARPPFDMYKTAVIDYAANNAIQVPWYYFVGYPGLSDILTSGIDAVWNGDIAAKDYIAKILPELQKYFDAHKN